ncbi:hypothetical protein NE236_21815 [Actinoallomurus purpureus]|uniref:hypothetical protein n=1 Tax=Actinoallomurus purpureus TaxID=478114 RepID=UPI002092A7FC|nr:hypothetical protein [Actinoallomurus purpureus]MCO6007618.1 hypothetical protein [Actinoallomurus purpureus]
MIGEESVTVLAKGGADRTVGTETMSPEVAVLRDRVAQDTASTVMGVTPDERVKRAILHLLDLAVGGECGFSLPPELTDDDLLIPLHTLFEELRILARQMGCVSTLELFVEYVSAEDAGLEPGHARNADELLEVLEKHRHGGFDPRIAGVRLTAKALVHALDERDINPLDERTVAALADMIAEAGVGGRPSAGRSTWSEALTVGMALRRHARDHGTTVAGRLRELMARS